MSFEAIHFAKIFLMASQPEKSPFLNSVSNAQPNTSILNRLYVYFILPTVLDLGHRSGENTGEEILKVKKY